MDQDIAVVHWGENANGGGDRVAWELQRVLDGPLYVGYQDESIEPDDVNGRELFSGRLSQWGIERGGVVRAASFFANWTVGATPLEALADYDVIVASGNETLFYCEPDTQTRIQYVHHTSRRHTDLLDTHPPGIKGGFGRAFAFVIRQLMSSAATRPDLFVANSEIVARRVHKYWGVPPEKIRVVYPPVPTHEYDHRRAADEGFYLTLSRLDWHKNIDELVRAFDSMPESTLKVAGDGPERDHLESIAPDNVEFLGYVDEDEKHRLLSAARAFVFNGRHEDFGIAPVEALAAGTPVLGVREGMTQYQVVDGKNGYSHVRSDQQGPQLREQVERFETEGVSWSAAEIAEFADRFSEAAFATGIREVVAEAVDRTDTTPEWYERLVDAE